MRLSALSAALFSRTKWTSRKNGGLRGLRGASDASRGLQAHALTRCPLWLGWGRWAITTIVLASLLVAAAGTEQLGRLGERRVAEFRRGPERQADYETVADEDDEDGSEHQPLWQ